MGNRTSFGLHKSPDKEALPVIKPTRNKKKNVVPLPAAFSHIDRHALKAPANVRSSVKSLVQYLVIPTRNDMDKVRAFYTWIADNIRYDIHGFLTGKSGPQHAEFVLRKGSGVCAGYSDLFQALCSESGIPCRKVHGFSKACTYDPEVAVTADSPTDHEWVIVYLNGEWRPVEPTWGAGHLDTDRKYVKSFQEAYFLSDPKNFIYDHFPYVNQNMEGSASLQLLKKPISVETFSSGLYPHIKGIEWGFRCHSHKKGLIDVNKEVEIRFSTREVDLEDVMCIMGSNTTNENCKGYVLVRKHGKRFSVKLTPPTEGKYYLELFGKAADSPGTSHDGLISFILRCHSALKNVRPYPEKNGVWGAKNEALQYGFMKDIFRNDVFSTSKDECEIRIMTKNRPTVFLELSHAELKLRDLNDYAFKHYNGNTLVITVRLPYVGFYKVTLFAQHEAKKDSKTLDFIADFLIESDREHPHLRSFPMSYTTADKYDCQLYEPLSGDLPSNQEVRLKLRSRVLAHVMINNEVSTGSNGMFNVTFKTPSAGEDISVYGRVTESGSFDGLYKFRVV